MISSAPARIVAGIVGPSAFAVFGFTVRSKLRGGSTGTAARIGTLEDLVYETRGAAEQVAVIGGQRHQSPFDRKDAEAVDRDSRDSAASAMIGACLARKKSAQYRLHSASCRTSNRQSYGSPRPPPRKRSCAIPPPSRAVAKKHRPMSIGCRSACGTEGCVVLLVELRELVASEATARG
jgi:hypothetical protein